MRHHMLMLAAAAIAVAALDACSLSGQAKKPRDQDRATVWMKKKLEVSQSILAGLTESDFDRIRTGAEALAVLEYLEKWDHADMPEYKLQVRSYDVANRQLIRMAKEKNLDGSLLAFNQLTQSCVQCHKVVRDAKK